MHEWRTLTLVVLHVQRTPSQYLCLAERSGKTPQK